MTHYISCDVVDTSRNYNMNGTHEPFNEETLLAEFTEEEKTALFKIPAAHNPEDLNLMATLYKKGNIHVLFVVSVGFAHFFLLQVISAANSTWKRLCIWKI